MTALKIHRRKRPCAECPWRKDTEPGQFPAERYEALRVTALDEEGGHAKLGAPLFACHKSAAGEPCACAGYLAAVGAENVTVRLFAATGVIAPEALAPGDDWPELFESYEEMAEAMGA